MTGMQSDGLPAVALVVCKDPARAEDAMPAVVSAAAAPAPIFRKLRLPERKEFPIQFSFLLVD